MIHRTACLLALLLALGLLPASPASAKEVSLRHGGITLHGLLDLAPGKTLADGVILMVHGTMQHLDFSTMRDVRTLLHAKGYSTLAVNFGLGVDRRRGLFDCERASTHRFGDAVGEIGAWLDWLQANGAKRVVLFGFSRGGQQAAWFSAERDHPVIASLVLLAPINPAESADSARYEAQFGKPLKPVLEQARALAQSGKGSALLKNVAFLNCPDTSVTAESFLSYYATDPAIEMPALLERVKQPAFVVVASADQVVRGLEKQLAPLADGKRLRFTVITGSDHFFRDLYGEDAVDEIVKFLRP
ncbi:MAG: alpha/beta hydrolase [Betaproteobacteria bacterium]|nr:alpha/beta hydrolase [Betaproteobacteria bacterium]